MKIEITQDISGTGDYRWELHTGPEHIDELPPHTLEWGLAYIFSFAEWIPYD